MKTMGKKHMEILENTISEIKNFYIIWRLTLDRVLKLSGGEKADGAKREGNLGSFIWETTIYENVKCYREVWERLEEKHAHSILRSTEILGVLLKMVHWKQIRQYSSLCVTHVMGTLPYLESQTKVRVATGAGEGVGGRMGVQEGWGVKCPAPAILQAEMKRWKAHE